MTGIPDIHVKCLDCQLDAMVSEFERTAAMAIVRINCPKCGKRTIESLVDTRSVSAFAAATRIFAHDGIVAQVRGDGPVRHEAVRTTAPDPPTLEELGLSPPVEEPPADRVQDAYEAWIATEDGRTVAKAIRDRALELRRRGWSSYGIQAIAEVVRFDHALRVGPDEAGYRVNNSHLSRLSRDLMAHYPELADFFEVRSLHALAE